MQTNTQSDKALTNYAHPNFLAWLPTWQKLNDAIDGGSDMIKLRGQKYLPATSGQIAQWSTPIPGVPIETLGDGAYVYGDCRGANTLGAYAYDLYRFRAIFPEYPSNALNDMVGRLIFAPAKVELPAGLEGLVKNATKDKQDFERLVETIYREQGKYSRCAILADFAPEEAVQDPYLCIYDALRVVNWSTTTGEDGVEKLEWAILDESAYKASGVKWTYRKILRVLALDEAGDYFTQTFDIDDVETAEDFDELNMLKPNEDAKYPEYKGNKSKIIPLVFINATNISATPELPIMSNITNTSLAIYRGEADYRQALFMQGQATPVFKGASAEERQKFLLGAQGAVFSDSAEFDASFMEVSGNGLAEMRESQDALHKHAQSEGLKLIESGANESGAALQQRGAEQTVSLNTLASTCEAGLTRMVEIVMEWGEASGDINIELNREFNEDSAIPQDLRMFMEAYNAGAPVTLRDIHSFARSSGLSQSEWEEVEAEMLDTSRNPEDLREDAEEADDKLLEEEEGEEA